MATEIEYELTFLAKKIPGEIKGVNGIPMHDIMVPDTVLHPHLRLRHQADPAAPWFPEGIKHPARFF